MKTGAGLGPGQGRPESRATGDPKQEKNHEGKKTRTRHVAKKKGGGPETVGKGCGGGKR